MTKPALRSSYSWLLAGLLATALVLPFVEQGRAGVVVLHALSAALIAAGLAAVAKRRRHVVPALVLAIPAVVLSAVELSGEVPGAAAARHALQTAFFAYTTALILADVVRGDRVSAEKIRGAVCILLLIGATWGFAYSTLLEFNPRALAFPAASLAAGKPWIGDVLYFSFITLTSVGYGDIVPVSPIARSMAWLEATAGQLYMAILVARLVGLHITYGATRDPGAGGGS